ncbi:MAG: hypothetical protein K6B69_02010 [Lachnospiraceae bacterium]|nr:hypothetical protein [Lachnospiraceae bacterium]
MFASQLLQDYFFREDDFSIYIRPKKIWVQVAPDLFYETRQLCQTEAKREYRRSVNPKETTVSSLRNENFEQCNFFDLIADPRALMPEKELILHEIREMLESSIEEALTPLQSAIIRSIYYNDRTEEETATLLNISRNKVHYSKTTALEKMKDYILQNGYTHDTFYEYDTDLEF